MDINISTVDQHCEFLRQEKHAGYWWCQALDFMGAQYSKPVRARDGRWWYGVKPGLYFPVEILKPSVNPAALKIGLYFGRQYRVEPPHESNSFLKLNMIDDLQAYSIRSVSKSKRSKIRSAEKSCEVMLLKGDINKKLLGILWGSWNENYRRTQWKKGLDLKGFVNRFMPHYHAPGVNILIAKRKSDELVLGYYIFKVVDGVFYGDSIVTNDASKSYHINDFLRFKAMRSAAICGVSTAYSSLVSNVENIERFKKSLGFVATAYPACLELNPVSEKVIKIFMSDSFKRLKGDLGT